MDVFHSLVIPTRNRQKFILDAVTYYLRDVENLGEVIVADNSDDRLLILEHLRPWLYDKRLKILASPEVTLSMKDNWERGIDQTSGDWVTFIGDDDILSPEFPFFLKNIVENNKSIDIEACKWRTINFSWKNVDVDGRRNPATIPIVGDQIHTMNSRIALDNILRWYKPERSNGAGPSIYHGVWRRSLINKVRDLNNGRVFDADTVDYDAGYNALFCTDQYFVVERPFSIQGACEESNSASVVDYKVKKDRTNQWIKEANSYDGLNDLSMPNSVSLVLYFLNKSWMKKRNYFVDVNYSNFMEGLSKDLVGIDPEYFDVFKDEIIKFIQENDDATELVEYLPVFKPEKRKKHAIGWNGFHNGQVILAPDKFADRVIEFADIAFSMLTPWQRVGTKYKIKHDALN